LYSKLAFFFLSTQNAKDSPDCIYYGLLWFLSLVYKMGFGVALTTFRRRHLKKNQAPQIEF
jgi:hypothetical protein